MKIILSIILWIIVARIFVYFGVRIFAEKKRKREENQKEQDDFNYILSTMKFTEDRYKSNPKPKPPSEEEAKRIEEANLKRSMNEMLGIEPED